ncbi:hypothetical protein CC1G_11728 [Coprinopsis cinerea okayama7|uniref:Uncharacterized protein n=1 Tax=Coprinopsis cinerea (strain Okayama-7 / 130 / ATCC MYA-4618 / FGSC 9003) TaxID=240176 RepID=A8NJY0_COPC7|nr:hypothetical protein CC1G_11728 [Coprinopsis cinerea okayama7\|eukprot:XP_001834319.1 hypothetical protein CC1G_11728 [Coprinopsis cinerea okayama7\
MCRPTPEQRSKLDKRRSQNENGHRGENGHPGIPATVTTDIGKEEVYGEGDPDPSELLPQMVHPGMSGEGSSHPIVMGLKRREPVVPVTY